MTIQRRLTPATWGTEDETQRPGSAEPTETPEERPLRAMVAGENEIIPIAYGRVELQGLNSVIVASGNDLLVACIWCMGQIQGNFQHYVNNEPLPASISVHNYVGSLAQGVDSWLASAISGYDDTYIYTSQEGERVGIAYSVFRVPPEAVSGMPKFSTRLYGRQVPIPGGTQSYSNNSARVLADLIRDPVLGLDRRLNIEWFEKAVAENAGPIGDVPRRSTNIVLKGTQSIERWVETLRAYADVTLAYDGGEVQLIPNSLAEPAAITVNPDLFIKDTFQVSYKQKDRAANRMTVTFTNMARYPATKDEISVDAPGNQAHYARETRVSMPGITDYSTAYRFAKERLNNTFNSPLVLRWKMADEGVQFLEGDLVEITNTAYGINAQVFRIVQVTAEGRGRWAFTAEQFDAANRDSTYIPPESIPEDSISTPVQPPSAPPDFGGPGGEGEILNLVLSQQNVDSNADPVVAEILATWDPVDSTLLQEYVVEGRVQGAPAWKYQYSVSTNAWTSPPTAVGVAYDVRVAARSTNGVLGGWKQASIRLTAPTDAPQQTLGLRASGGTNCFDLGALPFSIQLDWGYPLGQHDIVSVEIYHSTINSVASASLLTVQAYPTRTYTMSGLGPGETYHFWIRAVNTAGVKSAWQAVNGAPGTTSCNADKVLEYISGDITETDLHQSLVTKIDDKLGPDDPAVIAIEQDIDGLQGQYCVKIQSGNYVAGYGLAVDPTNSVKSQFLVQADRFAVGHPTQTPGGPAYPFIIQGGQVFIAKAAIGEAWINRAKIQDLEVVNGKLAYNSASDTYPVRTYGNSNPGNDTWYTIYSTNWNFSQTYAATFAGQVLFEAQGTDSIGDASPTMGLRLYFDGQLVKENRMAMPSSYTRYVASGTGTGYYQMKHAGSVELITVGKWATGSRGIINVTIQARIYTNYDRSTLTRYFSGMEGFAVLHKR